MAGNKKISFNMIASDIEKAENIELLFHGKNKEYKLTVKKVLGLSDAYNFINDVIDTCVDMEQGLYKPESLDFAVRIFTLVYYAGISNPTDAKKAYDVVYSTDLYNRVLNIIDAQQHIMLMEAINMRMEYAKECISSSALYQVNYLIQKMDQMMSESVETIETLNSQDFKDQIQKALSLVQPYNPEIDDDEIVEEIDSDADDSDNIVVLHRDVDE